MPTMHGIGIHHSIQRKHEWRFFQRIWSFFARIFGQRDREQMIRWFDKFIAVVGLVGPLMTAPQIMNVWIHHQVSGLAISSWGTYVCTSTFWLIYGILHKERAIILVNIAWVLSNASVVAGILAFQ